MAIKTFVFLALTLSLSAIGKAQAAPPGDFVMSVISEPVHLPEEIEKLRVDLKADGEVVLHAHRDGSEVDHPKQTLRLDQAALDSIYAKIEASQFFALDEFYGDERVYGGDKATIIVTANGRRKEVIALNIKVTDFDDIVGKLNEYLPDDRQIYYNALSKYADNYREVQR